MSDDQKVGPALTAEEWEHVKRNYSWLPQLDASEDVARRAAKWASDAAQEGKLHRTAALALYGQPFGFTRDELDDLRNTDPELPVFWDKLERLFAKISALLPPEPPDAAPTVERGGLSALSPDEEQHLRDAL